MWQHYFQEIAQSPWMAQAAPWIEAAKTAWNALSSLLMVGGLFWISQRLKSERRKIGALVSEFAGELNDKIGMTAEIAKAARNSAEAAATAAHAHVLPYSQLAPHWPKLQHDWQRVRERIDLAVMSIKHPYQRKKYAGFSRENYRDIIDALNRDGHIAPYTAEVLLRMNDRVHSLKADPTRATAADADNFQDWIAAADAGLPQHPGEQPQRDLTSKRPSSAE